MAVYISGLVMITGAVELVLALFVADRASVPALPSLFWAAYLGTVVALVIVGALLVVRGLRALRRVEPPVAAADA